MLRTATFCLALLLGASSTLVSLTTAIPYDDIQMVCLVNRERARSGLKPLGIDPQLTAASRAHSQDMARSRRMSHNGSDGSSPATRARRAGYTSGVGENVAYGYNSMEQVMRTWMNSPGHRQNIMGARYTCFGSGMAMAGNTPYFTQMFGQGGGRAVIPKCDGSDGPYTGGAPAPAPAPTGNKSGGGSAPPPTYKPAPTPAPAPSYKPAPTPAPAPTYKPAPTPAPTYAPAPAPTGGHMSGGDSRPPAYTAPPTTYPTGNSPTYGQSKPGCDDKTTPSYPTGGAQSGGQTNYPTPAPPTPSYPTPTPYPTGAQGGGETQYPVCKCELPTAPEY